MTWGPTCSWACQVKAGPSYFAQPARAEDRSLLGWWYYEEDADHFDDWVTHGLPHLLVLHDLDRRVSYWVHVTAKAVESTGKGAKILVPAHQTIDPEHLDELLDVAASHKPVIDLQGTAWAASARNLPPARRLRHALLVPRLVALHPNTGFETVIGPGEALALLAQGRVRHLGDVAPARQDAAAALRALLGDSDDVTASAIRAVAAELLSSDEFGLSVERTATLHPLWQWQCGRKAVHRLQRSRGSDAGMNWIGERSSFDVAIGYRCGREGGGEASLESPWLVLLDAEEDLGPGVGHDRRWPGLACDRVTDRVTWTADSGVADGRSTMLHAARIGWQAATPVPPVMRPAVSPTRRT